MGIGRIACARPVLPAGLSICCCEVHCGAKSGTFRFPACFYYVSGVQLSSLPLSRTRSNPGSTDIHCSPVFIITSLRTALLRNDPFIANSGSELDDCTIEAAEMNGNFLHPTLREG